MKSLVQNVSFNKVISHLLLFNHLNISNRFLFLKPLALIETRCRKLFSISLLGCDQNTIMSSNTHKSFTVACPWNPYNPSGSHCTLGVLFLSLRFFSVVSSSVRELSTTFLFTADFMSFCDCLWRHGIDSARILAGDLEIVLPRVLVCFAGMIVLLPCVVPFVDAVLFFSWSVTLCFLCWPCFFLIVYCCYILSSITFHALCLVWLTKYLVRFSAVRRFSLFWLILTAIGCFCWFFFRFFNLLEIFSLVSFII